MENLEDESLTSSKYLGKVSIGEDGNVIINSVNLDVAIGSGTRIVICDRDGELIAVVPEDDEVFRGDIKEIIQTLEEVIEGMDDAENVSRSCYVGTCWRDDAREKIRKTQTALENMKEKTCTLTWRSDGVNLADCSNCGEGQLYDDYNYCPSCGAKNIDPEDKSPDPPGIQRCPGCGTPYDPKPGVFMLKCIDCGSDMMGEPSDDHPDGEVDIPPEASQIGMMDPVDEDFESLPPDGEDFDWSTTSPMQKVPTENPEFLNCPGCGVKYQSPRKLPDVCLRCGYQPPSEELEVPSDEYFEEAKRHEMELMGGAPDHLRDRAYSSLHKMMSKTEESEKPKVPGEVMDDRECPRCGAVWPFEGTDHGTLKQPVCPSCGCGIARRKRDPGIVLDEEDVSK